MSDRSRVEWRFGWSEWKRIPNWLWGAWPFWLPAGIAVAHAVWQLEAHAWFGFSACDLLFHNRLIAAALQLLGGGLVIYSIDSNLRMFEGRNTIRHIGSYFGRIPFANRYHLVTSSVTIQSAIRSDSSSGLHSGGQSLKQRVEQLEREIKRLDAAGDTMRDELQHAIDALSEKLGAELSTVKTEMGRIDDRLKSATVGGVALQLVGIWLLVHSTVASLLT